MREKSKQSEKKNGNTLLAPQIILFKIEYIGNRERWKKYNGLLPIAIIKRNNFRVSKNQYLEILFLLIVEDVVR
jgi:hypothetical protein